MKTIRIKNTALIIEDPLEIKQAIKASDALSTLFNFDQWLRDEIKYRQKPYEKIRNKLNELMNDNEIDLDELYI